MKRLGLLLAMTAALTFCVGPFLWQVLTSLRPETEQTRLALPTRPTLQAYAEVFEGRAFAQVMLNSFAVASLTTLLCLAIGALAAFALARLPVPGRGALLAAALGASMFPPIATVGPLFLLIRALGLRDQLAGLVLPYATFALPLTLWVLTAHFRQLPPDLYRAARIDGCTPFAAFWRVLLPLAAPGLVTTGLLVFIFSWNEFLYALTFTSSPEHRTVPVAIALFASEHAEPWAQIAAASVIVTLPLVILTLAFQRRLVSGLTAGAVKG
ncbi:MAG: Maltose/maltodextrin transporter, permease protein MalG [Myxococcaceae bacterium]|nr:Maltose/maltodextrin transporter, permease protein MalG [Myxococcaceae bacterium]